jgi:hypothetical protein
MLRSSSLIVTMLVLWACAKDKDDKAQANSPPPPPAPAVVADAAPALGSAAAAGSAAPDEASAGTADSSAAGAGSAIAAASAVPFAKLAHDDKVKFMKQKVMPAMKPAFQKFDSKEFSNFTCKTCHGKDPQKVKYEMPNRHLPALDFDAIKAGKEDPKMVEFMAKVVKPEMARLLGEPEMSDTQPDGFGCLHCHTLKKK